MSDIAFSPHKPDLPLSAKDSHQQVTGDPKADLANSDHGQLGTYAGPKTTLRPLHDKVMLKHDHDQKRSELATRASALAGDHSQSPVSRGPDPSLSRADRDK